MIFHYMVYLVGADLIDGPLHMSLTQVFPVLPLHFSPQGQQLTTNLEHFNPTLSLPVERYF